MLNSIMIKEKPYEIFKSWYEEAKKNRGEEATAFCLSTVNNTMKPSSRMVLLKKFDKNGFVFFTNLGSKKSKDILDNDSVSMCFYWYHIDKQIRIEGKAKLIADFESDRYFNSRNIDSKIGAHLSKQSSILEGDMNDLKKDFEKLKSNIEEKKIRRPTYWGGYRIKPDMIEFWKAGEARLHERIVFKFINSKWNKYRLYP